MLLTGKEDLRVRKTMTAIKSAFEGLVCEKNYEQITVKELSAGYLERVKDYRKAGAGIRRTP